MELKKFFKLEMSEKNLNTLEEGEKILDELTDLLWNVDSREVPAEISDEWDDFDTEANDCLGNIKNIISFLKDIKEKGYLIIKEKKNK